MKALQNSVTLHFQSQTSGSVVFLSHQNHTAIEDLTTQSGDRLNAAAEEPTPAFLKILVNEALIDEGGDPLAEPEKMRGQMAPRNIGLNNSALNTSTGQVTQTP